MLDGGWSYNNSNSYKEVKVGITMKTLRVLLVSVISFCLLNVQMVMTTQGLKVTSNVTYANADGTDGSNGDSGDDGNQQQTNSQNYQTTQNYAQQEADTQGHGLMNQIMLLVIGYIVAGWFIKCSQPLPIDMISAAVGAGILIIGEITSIAMYQGTAAEMEMAYQADHEGKMLNNDDQVEAFRKEKENNENIRDAIQVKLGMQAAAMAAFGVALGIAIYQIVTFMSMGALCISGAAALSICPVPCNAQCAPIAGMTAGLMGLDAVPGTSLAEKTTKTAQLATINACPACIAFAQYATNTYYAGCATLADSSTPTVPGPPGFSEQMYAKLFKVNPKIAPIAKSFASEYNMKNFTDDPEVHEQVKEEMDLEAIVDSGFTKKIGKFENDFLKGEYISLKINPQHEDEFFHYLKIYEGKKFKDGEIRSVSLDEYENYKSLYSYEGLGPDETLGMKKLLATAANYGLDLMFPKAEANFGTLLTLVGGALLVLLPGTSFMMDLMLGSATKRAITYAGFMTVTGVALAGTAEDLSATNDNIDKLDEILNNLSNLNPNAQVTHTQPPSNGGGGGGLDRPQIPPPDNGSYPTTTDGKPTPCLAGQTNGKCNSVSEKFKAAQSVPNFDLGADLSSSGNQIAAIGDDLSNTDSLGSGTIGKLNSLSNQQGAISKLNKRLKDMMNKERKKNKLDAIDLDKLAGSQLDKMRAAMLKKMKENNLTPSGVLASTSSGLVPSSNKKDGKGDKALKDAKAALAAAKGKAVAGKGKTKAPKIGFDFGDNKAGIGGGDGEGLDDPNTIGEDEEYVLDDIVEDKGASLWQIISVRYLKSGYNRLSGDKKTAPSKISE